MVAHPFHEPSGFSGCSGDLADRTGDCDGTSGTVPGSHNCRSSHSDHSRNLVPPTVDVREAVAEAGIMKSDVVKGVAISAGLWVAYSIVFLTVPFVLTGDVVLVLIACVLIGVVVSQYLAYRRDWAEKQRILRLTMLDDAGAGYAARDWRVLGRK